MNKIAVVLFAVLLSLAESMAANAQEEGFGDKVMAQLPGMVSAAMQQETDEKWQKQNNSVVLENKPGRWGILVWCCAYHPDDKQHRLNDFTPGIGGRYHFDDDFLGGHAFFDVNYIAKNSFQKPTLAVGPGIIWPVFSVNDVLVSAGGEVPLIEYWNKDNKKIPMFGLVPMLAFAKSYWALDLGFLPNKGEKNGKGMIAAVVALLERRF